MKDRDPLAGTPYRALKALGRGAMGEVLLAEHRVLKSTVCVKLIHDALASEPSIVERFHLEARALATMGGGQHPNLVRVHDVGVTEHGQPYFVMEHLRGRTLQEARKERGAIPWLEALGWVVQALRGLEAAHAEGVVHRDLKPANLFVCNPIAPDAMPVVKVLDFGIAKLIANSSLPALSVPTAAGIMLGTPRYAAPEQIRGDHVSASADVYSMGLVLFELCSGLPPYASARSANEVLLAQVFDALPQLSSACEQVIPDTLELVVARATHKEAGERYADAAAFRAALESVRDAPARPLPARLAPEHDVQRPRATVPLPPLARSARPTLPTLVLSAAQSEAASEVAPQVHASPLRVTPSPARRVSAVPSFILITILSTLVFGVLGWWALTKVLR